MGNAESRQKILLAGTMLVDEVICTHELDCDYPQEMSHVDNGKKFG
jgi:hypothetical protein